MFLHVIQSLDLENRRAGAYKDIISRVEWLKNQYDDYRQVLVAGDNPAPVGAAWKDKAALKGALIEGSFCPQIVRRIKQREPKACVAVRVDNLEPLKHLGNYGWWPQRGPVWMLKGMVRLVGRDLLTKRFADVILSINEWESHVYWNRLPGKASVDWLPYRCPDDQLPENMDLYEHRTTIACVTSSKKNRSNWDAVIRFQQFAKQMKKQGYTGEFVITGELHKWGLPKCAEVSYSGLIDSLADFLGECRAVALLSPLGCEFKTTVADALAAGAHVIAHPKLIGRNPPVVRPHMLAHSKNSPQEIDRLIELLKSESHGTSFHQELCEHSERVMMRWMGDTPA